jgi:hypothetical protein
MLSLELVATAADDVHMEHVYFRTGPLENHVIASVSTFKRVRCLNAVDKPTSWLVETCCLSLRVWDQVCALPLARALCEVNTLRHAMSGEGHSPKANTKSLR